MPSPTEPMPSFDPKERFSSRVADYERHRPDYPAALYDVLLERAGLGGGGPGSDGVVADIGAGTGLSCGPLVERGLEVIAVEPNAEMRAAAERRFAGRAGFRAVDGTAERTTLPDASCDLVIAAQAFHWFDPPGFASECRRILKPGRVVAVMWNRWDVADSPFSSDYSELMDRFNIDPDARPRDHRQECLRDLFGQGGGEHHTFPHRQLLDEEALIGRARSSSYCPGADHPLHEGFIEALRELFRRHSRDGVLLFPYTTELYLGPPATGDVAE